MGRGKVTDADFIDFLIATPKQATATEAARSQPVAADPRVAAAAHDAYTRLLHRLEPDADALWAEVEPDVRRTSGVLVVDDSVLDKPYARAMDLVHRQCSGKHHGVVKGISLVTLLWTDGDRHLPYDYRLYDKATTGRRRTTSSASCWRRPPPAGSPPSACCSTRGTRAWPTSSGAGGTGGGG